MIRLRRKLIVRQRRRRGHGVRAYRRLLRPVVVPSSEGSLQPIANPMDGITQAMGYPSGDSSEGLAYSA